MSFFLTDGRFKAVDSAGLPLTGGKLYTYASGTTTDKATYTSSTLATPNTNPITLDSRGEAQVWLDAGAYTFVLKTSALTTIWTVDGVQRESDAVTAFAADLANDTDPAKGPGLIGYDKDVPYTTGVGKALNDVQTTINDTRRTAEYYGVVGGGTVDDTTTLQAAITSAIADGYEELYLTNPDGYKITGQIVQPQQLHVIGCGQLIRAETVTPGSGTAVWVIDYDPNIDDPAYNDTRWHMHPALSDVLIRGHASPADSTWTANLYGVEYRGLHIVTSRVTCTGFDRAFTVGEALAPTSDWRVWMCKWIDCVAFYSQYGVHTDFSTAGGLSGAGMEWRGGGIAHCDYNVYNNLGELTFTGTASDAPIKMHVKDNVTILSSNEIGFMHWQNCRIEGGGTSGSPWVKNSGLMRFNNCFVTERNAADEVFETASTGYTVIEGGTWRTSDGRYKAKGSGVITQRGIRPINDNNGVLLAADNSNFLNGDLRDGLTTGWTGTTGSPTLANVSDALYLLSGKALSITGASTVTSSSNIELDYSCQSFAVTFRGSNANAGGVTVNLKQYNRAGYLITTGTTGIPAAGTGVPLHITGKRQGNAVYMVIEVVLAAGQSSVVKVGDFYLSQW